MATVKCDKCGGTGVDRATTDAYNANRPIPKFKEGDRLGWRWFDRGLIVTEIKWDEEYNDWSYGFDRNQQGLGPVDEGEEPILWIPEVSFGGERRLRKVWRYSKLIINPFTVFIYDILRLVAVVLLTMLWGVLEPLVEVRETWKAIKSR